MSMISDKAPDWCDCPKCTSANRQKEILLQIITRVAYQLKIQDRDLASVLSEILLATLVGKTDNVKEYLDFVDLYITKYIKPFAENAADHLITKNNEYLKDKDEINKKLEDKYGNGKEVDGLIVRTKIIDEESGVEFTTTTKH